MENGDFPFDADILKKEKIRQIRPENISLFIELSQLSHNPKVVTHIYEESEEVCLEICIDCRENYLPLLNYCKPRLYHYHSHSFNR